MKEPSKAEIINDTNRMVINFYEQLKNNYSGLESLVQSSLHSRAMHHDAFVMYSNPHLFSDLQLAWAFWILTNQGFRAAINNSWSSSNEGKKDTTKIASKKALFCEDLKARIETVQLECRDAIDVIKGRDREDTFFYIDPPYYNSNMGHYGGYTLANFKELLSLLSKLKGKFLLSSYPSDALSEFTDLNGWHTKWFDMNISASAGNKRKIEVLTSNYPI